MAKIQIIYVIGDGSKNDNQELRWSLRSLEKFARDDDGQLNVEPIIVGTVPDWFAGASIRTTDPTNRKAKNMFHKIVSIVDSKLVSGEFLCSSDDHFLLRTVNFERWPRYFRNAILAEYNGGNNYAKTIATTRDVLLENGYPAIDFTCHCNEWMDTETFPIAKELEQKSLKHPMAEYGILPYGVMTNLALLNPAHRRQIVWKKDVKIGNVGDEEMKRISDTEICCSCNDDAFLSAAFRSFMYEAFENKSRWEK